MELKTFISQTLTEIIEGVKQAQEATKESGAIINPSQSKENYICEWNGNRTIGDVQFSVGLKVEENENLNAKIGVISGIFSFGAKGENQESTSANSNIKFSVPVALPVDDNLKKKKGGIGKSSLC